uniref:Uncharacterized protein AlNc14C64G4561 n=1 Tax=Albugo laibachii Nc14 TaxID=890382 RepID=F0WD40_9STRA|nr:conserved hypothetical protein [Albugo laibachii Nc14]|eukprot:CCA19112.1 conserved hypothetical protein [Albugo laibachii Nc14]
MERLYVPKCATNMENRLAALRHDQEIDGLRTHLIKYNLFPHHRDPQNSPIRIEELKELVKHWKLHRQRGFWRDHPEKEDLVRALLQHIKHETLNKKRRQEAHAKYRAKMVSLTGNGVSGSPAGADVSKLSIPQVIESKKDKPDLSLVFGELHKEQANQNSNKRFGGKADLFYQRGTYDEGMLYLSRIDRIKWMSDLGNLHDRDQAFGSTTELLDIDTYPADEGVTDKGIKVERDKGTSKVLLGSVSCPTLLPVSLMKAAGLTSQQIGSLSKELKKKCVQGLHSLSCIDGAEGQLLRENALSTLMILSKVEDPFIRLYTAATLYNMTCTRNKEVYTKLVDEGVVATIVELSHIVTQQYPLLSKTLCARMLLRLTTNESYHARVVLDGGAVILSQMMTMSTNSDDVRQVCLNALINLAEVPRAVSCDSIISTLALLLKGRNEALGTDETLPLDETRELNLAQGLLNLSMIVTTRSAIIEDGAMTSISSLIDSENPQIRYIMSCVLRNLAAFSGNQEVMMKQGALSLVKKLLYFSRSHENDVECGGTTEGGLSEFDQASRSNLNNQICRNCISVIAYFCGNDRLKTRLTESDWVLKYIIAVLNQIDRKDTEYFEKFHENEKNCFICLANLAMEDRCRVPVLHAGSVSILLRSLQSTDQCDTLEQQEAMLLLKLDCVVALSQLMLNAKNFHQIVQEGVIPTFFSLICKQSSSRTDMEIQCACIHAMLLIARDAVLKVQLIKVGQKNDGMDKVGSFRETVGQTFETVSTMLTFALRNIENVALCGNCLEFFYELSTQPDNLPVLYNEHVELFLVNVLRQMGNTKVIGTYSMWLLSLRTLSNFATDTGKSHQLLEQDIVEVLYHVLKLATKDTRKRGTEENVLVEDFYLMSVKLLHQLQPIMLGDSRDKEAGARSDGPSLACLAASVVLIASRVAKKASHHAEEERDLRNDATIHCALTLARLCVTEQGLRTCVACSSILATLNSILRSGLPAAQLYGAICICNLAGALATESEKDIWLSDTIEDFTVLILLRVNGSPIKQVGAKALFNLLANESRHNEMIRRGVFFSLFKLSTSQSSSDIRQLSLRALYNLTLPACTEGREIVATLLVEMEMIKSLAAMMQNCQLTDSDRRQFCGILRNFASWPGFSMRIAHDGILLLLQSLSEIRDVVGASYIANAYYNIAKSHMEHSIDLMSLLLRKTNALVPTLVKLLLMGDSLTRQYAAKTIAHLSGYASALSIMTKCEVQGNDLTLVSICEILNLTLQHSKACCVGTAGACVFALRNLLTFSSLNQQRFIECGGVPTLADLLTLPAMVYKVDTLRVAAELVCDLAQMDATEVETIQERLVNDGIIRILYSVAQSATRVELGSEGGEVLSSSILLRIIYAMAKLSESETCQVAMLRDNVLNTIVSLATTEGTTSPFEDVLDLKGEAFALYCSILSRNLSRPSRDAQSGTGFSETREICFSAQPMFVRLLLTLSHSSSLETQEHVVIALYNLCDIPEYHLQILKLHGVKDLLRLGTTPPLSLLKRHACSLTLQRLFTRDNCEKDSYSVLQEGIVTAISALGDTHQHIQQLGSIEIALHQVVSPQAQEASETNEHPKLLPYTEGVLLQPADPPDWTPMVIEAATLHTVPKIEPILEVSRDSAENIDRKLGPLAISASGNGHNRDKSRSIAGTDDSMGICPRALKPDNVTGAYRLLGDDDMRKALLDNFSSTSPTHSQIYSAASRQPLTEDTKTRKALPKLEKMSLSGGKERSSADFREKIPKLASRTKN